MRGLLLALLVALAGPAVAQLPGLLPPDPAGPPVRERLFITDASAGLAFWGAFDTFERTYVDLTADGKPEIVAQNDDGRTFVFGRDGKLLASLHVARRADAPVRDLNGVAAADLDRDGLTDLVVATAMGRVVRAEAVPQGSGVRLDTVWTQDLGPMDAPATLADVDGDGVPEAFLQNDGRAGQHALRANGSALWTSQAGDGNAAALLADLDGDRDLEAVFATDGGLLLAYEAATGRALWTARLPASPGSVAIAPVAVDFEGDGDLDVVAAARNIHDGGAGWIERSHAVVAAFDSAGKPLWTFTADWLNPLVGAKPAVHDVDGDGAPDLVYVDWNTPGHKPGSWERLPTASAFALDGAGRLLWRHEFPVYWSNRAPIVLDVTGDDAPEVLVIDERDGESGLLALSLAGDERARWPLREGWLANRGAEPVDLDGDGLLELVVPMARVATGCPWDACREGALLVLSTKGDAAQLTATPPPRGEPPAQRESPPPATGKGRISGFVVAQGGAVLEGARVAVQNVGELATDEQGYFTIEAQPGRHTVRIDADGFATQVLAVDVQAGKESTVRVTLLPETAVVRGAPDVPWALALAGAALVAAALRRR